MPCFSFYWLIKYFRNIHVTSKVLILLYAYQYSGQRKTVVVPHLSYLYCVYTIQPVVKPVVRSVGQPAASCIQTFNRLSNRLYNRFDSMLYRVNGVLEFNTCSRLQFNKTDQHYVHTVDGPYEEVRQTASDVNDMFFDLLTTFCCKLL